MQGKFPRRNFVRLMAGSACALTVTAAAPALFAAGQSATTIPAANLIEPAALNAMLQKGGVGAPLILQVGFHSMFDQKHIAGSEYAGPASQQAGLDLLAHRVASMQKNSFLVLYCGCCPWQHCPNIAPAMAHLRSLGFTRVQALAIPNNFGADWVAKGYQVA